MSETAKIIISVIVAFMSCTGFYTLVEFLIRRRDKKTETRLGISKDVKNIIARQNELELDNKRTQLLLLMKEYPRGTNEILTVAQYYFCQLNGDWYMYSIFCQWLKENEIERPIWLKEEK